MTVISKHRNEPLTLTKKHTTECLSVWLCFAFICEHGHW